MAERLWQPFYCSDIGSGVLTTCFLKAKTTVYAYMDIVAPNHLCASTNLFIQSRSLDYIELSKSSLGSHLTEVTSLVRPFVEVRWQDQESLT